MEDDAFISVRVRISGRVQGVWFRGWTAERAQSLEVDGWVRNCSDGTVEAVFVGSKLAVDQLIAACHDGPPAAQVGGVAIEAILPPSDIAAGSGFETRTTK